MFGVSCEISVTGHACDCNVSQETRSLAEHAIVYAEHARFPEEAPEQTAPKLCTASSRRLIEPRVSRTVGLVTLRDRAHPPSVGAFLRHALAWRGAALAARGAS